MEKLMNLPVVYNFIKSIKIEKKNQSDFYCKKYNDSDYRLKKNYKQIIFLK